jgi:adenosylmethionine-8-amino-7-oxononanoate aminotransferase
LHWTEIDKNHVWHPYNALPSKTKILPVAKTRGTTITLDDGQELTDAMSSWWSAIHGYNHPRLTKALTDQAAVMPHIMFGGLAHEKAALLSQKLVDLTGLNSVFLCDSGSVSVEVALKTAIQYQEAKGKHRYKFIALEHSYHGDTLAAMSVCDPQNSMHSIYGTYLPRHIFTPAPKLGFKADVSEDIARLEETVQKHHEEAAAIILEPVVQGAGGMRIYNPDYLKAARKLCDQYGLLLIADEIATGFGHTGRMFACEHAGIKPDIMTVGKGLTGGYMTMAAMITSKDVSDTISDGEPGVVMHGPTFMANPLSSAVALESITMLQENHWQDQVAGIESIFSEGLDQLKDLDIVQSVRNIGAIGVAQLKDPSYAQRIQDRCQELGVWIRPFGALIYSIVAYTITPKELQKIIDAMLTAIKEADDDYRARHNNT